MLRELLAVHPYLSVGAFVVLGLSLLNTIDKMVQR
jgi:hypothetical protein